MKHLKLSEYCRKHNISYPTGYSWFKKGQIEGARQMPSGTILIPDEPSSTDRNVIYLRIHPTENKEKLYVMQECCEDYCQERDIEIHDIYSETAPVEDESRPELWKMLRSDPGMIILYEKEALTTTGFEILKHLLRENNCYVQLVPDKSFSVS